MKEKNAVGKETDVEQWTETKYLTANDRMKNKLLEGMREELKDCIKEDELKW